MRTCMPSAVGAETRGSKVLEGVQGHPKTLIELLSQNTKIEKWAGDVAMCSSATECLPSVSTTLSSVPSTTEQSK